VTTTHHAAEPGDARSSGRPRSIRLPRTARRSQLLGAAREVFVAQGYHASAMDDIAERAGVSKPVLYQHFPSKYELYLALIDQHAKEIVDGVREALLSTDDAENRVGATIAAFFEFVDRDEESFRLVFESDLTSDQAVQDRVDWVIRESAHAIAAVIIAESGRPAEDAELLGVALSGMANVTARFWLRDNREMDREHAVALLSQLAWGGISRPLPPVGPQPLERHG
jgi:AcrR family transcriptional regulator